MKAVLLGATRGMGRALARELAGRGHPLFLLGRDPEDLGRSAADLLARGAAEAGSALCDLAEPSSFDPALEAADRALGEFDTLVLSAAEFATQDALEASETQLRRLLEVNFSGSLLLLEAARKRLLARGGGRLVVFSSVAGDRARRTIGLYGATKAGLSHYVASLDARFRRQGLLVTCVKPGFVRTSMTQALDPPPFAGEPEAVARRVLRAVERGKPVVYAPAVWWAVMRVIRLLPRPVMRVLPF